MVTLTANVAVVPVEHLAAFRGPAACPSDPKHTYKTQTRDSSDSEIRSKNVNKTKKTLLNAIFFQLTQWSGSRRRRQAWFSPPSPAGCTPR